MQIEVNNVRARIVHATEAEVAWLLKFCSIHTKGRGGRHKVVSLVDSDGEFPAGFCGFIKLEHARLGEVEQPPDWRPRSVLRFADRRTPVGEIVIGTTDISWLYDYQRDAVEAVLAAKRGVVKASTASGKTECLAAIVMCVTGVRWLALAPRTQLAANIATRYLRRLIEADLRALMGKSAKVLAKRTELESYLAEIVSGRARNKVGPYRVGFVGDGEWDVEDGDTLICATFQSLYANLSGRGGELLESATGLLIDETHTAAADSYSAVVDRAANAYWRVGFSATPVSRTDGKNALVLGSTGRVIYEIRAEVLIDKGVYAAPTVHFIEHDVGPDLPGEAACSGCSGKGEIYDAVFGTEVPCSKCKGRGETRPVYAACYDFAICKSPRRNELIVETALVSETPVLIFVERALHGKAIQKLLGRELGRPVGFIDQNSNTAKRDDVIREIEKGEISHVVVSKVFREGIDAPNIRTVINASGGKSTIKILQQMGRGARVRKDKVAFTYYDIFDIGDKTLRAHSAARARLIRSEIGVEPVIKRLPKPGQKPKPAPSAAMF